ncbi:uncharacterized protein LOC122277025 [Carya illinoinensis]|uniref:uncharacterized protein LOC122277025 n=1 Tax=Carya illinoinensis TaxID=32201 RepID=UPI001C71EEC3|nr:uncharacterized protein LOC122277025 [Carya illinoinensis]
MGDIKKEGGLRFRDIDNFNKAMLAKQGWMLQTKVDSLTTRILKEKYYRKGQFVEAKLGYKPSYMWRSLLAAQGLVKAGSVWRVGNGKSIAIWIDNWLPNAAGFKVSSPVNRLEVDSKAVNSILPTRQNLRQRRVIEDASCPICGLKDETIDHVLWSCPAAADVWAENDSGLQKWICEEKEFFNIWSDMQETLQKNKVAEAVMILRGLWTRRNNLVFEGKFESPTRVVTNALSRLKCFQAS